MPAVIGLQYAINVHFWPVRGILNIASMQHGILYYILICISVAALLYTSLRLLMLYNGSS